MKRPLTIREEANTFTCWAFRHSYLKELHAGTHSEFLKKPGFSRITDATMKKLIIRVSAKMMELLTMIEGDLVENWKHTLYFHEHYCYKWEQ